MGHICLLTRSRRLCGCHIVSQVFRASWSNHLYDLPLPCFDNLLPLRMHEYTRRALDASIRKLTSPSMNFRIKESSMTNLNPFLDLSFHSKYIPSLGSWCHFNCCLRVANLELTETPVLVSYTKIRPNNPKSNETSAHDNRLRIRIDIQDIIILV